jgi:predicted metal-binding protein
METDPMTDTHATVFVCVSCKVENTNPETRPGRLLLDAVAAALADRGETRIAARPVECLAVCKRPCTVALSAAGKWTYVVGDLTAPANIDDIISAALAFAASDTGIVPWRDRPQSFRRGVVARIPPL